MNMQLSPHMGSY